MRSASKPPGGRALTGAWPVALTAALAMAQEPEPVPAPVPPPAVPPTAEAVRMAEDLLRAQAVQSRAVAVLTADFVQRRTTKLAKEPLTSRGSFLFVRQPGCVVFRTIAPRESVVRLRAGTYEVFRPQRKQLERFVLEGPELAQGLFAALGGDAIALLREFEVRACSPDAGRPGHTLVVLSPRRPDVRERLTELRLCLRTGDATLFAVAYRDPSDDLVEIELHGVVANPPQPPTVEFDLPADTNVVEHRVPKKRP